MQKLKFSVNDIDNKSAELTDDDFLGGMECTLGQVREGEGQGRSELALC